MAAGTSQVNMSDASGAGSAPAPTTVAAQVSGPPGHPMADLRRLAVHLGAHAAVGSDLSDIAGLPGPQLLEELGQRFGLSIAMVSKRPDAITGTDCPCVLLMKDGSSRLLLDVPDGRVFVIAGEGDEQLHIDRALLEKQASGGILQARANPDAAVSQPVDKVVFEGANTGGPNPMFAHLRSVAAQKKQLVLALAMAGFLSGLINLAVPVFSMVVFDRVIPHSAFETLWVLVIGIVLLLALDLVLRHVRHALGDAVSLAASTSFGAKVFSRLLHVPLAQLPRSAGSLVQPFQELNAASTIGPQFIAGLMVDVPFFLLVLGFIAALGGWIAAIPAMGVVMLLMIHWIGHHLAMRDLGDEARLAQRQTQMIMDAVQAGEPIRINGAGPSLLMRWEERSDAAAFAGHKLRSRQNFANHCGAIVMQGVTVATIAAGAYAVSASLMTVGALSACMMLASRAVIPVAAVMGQGFRLRQIMQTTAAISMFAGYEPEQAGDRSDSAKGQSIRGSYRFTNASFSHSGSQVAVIQQLSLTIGAGERVAIIGKSGSGKSTLLRLMTRLHDATDGTIHIDGRDLRQLDPLTLRRAVSLMPQDPYLFDATLEANMKAGLGPVGDVWFNRVAEIAGVGDFASRKPEGYSLATGPGGHRLSGGERQSVTLARALMGKPALLLLDEPTSAMDNERETRIIKALAQEMRDGELRGMGLVIATHRLPILTLVDRIVWLDSGKIIADGPKDEIFRKFGLAA